MSGKLPPNISELKLPPNIVELVQKMREVKLNENPGEFASANEQQDPCSHCGELGKLFRCSACKSVSYCSKACQKAAWKNGHKTQCAEMKAHTHQPQGKADKSKERLENFNKKLKRYKITDDSSRFGNCGTTGDMSCECLSLHTWELIPWVYTDYKFKVPLNGQMVDLDFYFGDNPCSGIYKGYFLEDESKFYDRVTTLFNPMVNPGMGTKNIPKNDLDVWMKSSALQIKYMCSQLSQSIDTIKLKKGGIFKMFGALAQMHALRCNGIHFDVRDTKRKLYISLLDYNGNGVFVDRWSSDLKSPNPLVFMRVTFSESKPKTFAGMGDESQELMPITRKAVSVFLSMLRENSCILSAPLLKQLENQSNPYKLDIPKSFITFLRPCQPIPDSDTELDAINKRVATYKGNLMGVNGTMYNIDLSTGAMKEWDVNEHE